MEKSAVEETPKEGLTEKKKKIEESLVYPGRVNSCVGVFAAGCNCSRHF